jgi:hypothetical protein
MMIAVWIIKSVKFRIGKTSFEYSIIRRPRLEIVFRLIIAGSLSSKVDWDDVSFRSLFYPCTAVLLVDCSVKMTFTWKLTA